MTHPFGYKRGQPYVWHHTRPARGNRHCLYCGVVVGEGSTVDSDREHLVGRNFVPTGAFAPGDFNLIFRACRTCNGAKAELERHVASATLFTSPGREDPAVDALARRKAGKDRHPAKPGVLLQDAGDAHEIRLGHQGSGAAISLAFGLISPPQLYRPYAAELASYHVQGLFSWVHSPDPRTAGGTALLDPDLVRVLGIYPEADWGNPQLVELARRVAGWPAPALVDAAGGHFKAVLRSSPGPQEPRFWALEWNRSTRVVGVLAPADAELALTRDLPPLAWHPIPTGRIREEIPLTGAADLLFVAPARES